MAQRVQFEYTNHRGETRVRTVDIDRINWLDEPGFGYAAGWFATGIDVDSGEIRSFRLDPERMKPSPEGPVSAHGANILLVVR